MGRTVEREIIPMLPTGERSQHQDGCMITELVCVTATFGFTLKVPYYTVFYQYIIGLRYIQNMSLKCLAPNTKQIMHCSIP